MNKDLFESKWKEIRIQATTWWSLMSEYDLVKVDKAEIKLDKFVTMLQTKYGYAREQAKMEIGEHVTAYEARQKASL